MTHDKPFLRPHTACTPATIVWGAREHPLTPNEMLLMIGYMIADLQSRHVVEVVPCQEIRDE